MLNEYNCAQSSDLGRPYSFKPRFQRGGRERGKDKDEPSKLTAIWGSCADDAESRTSSTIADITYFHLHWKLSLETSCPWISQNVLTWKPVLSLKTCCPWISFLCPFNVLALPRCWQRRWWRGRVWDCWGTTWRRRGIETTRLWLQPILHKVKPLASTVRSQWLISLSLH